MKKLAILAFGSLLLAAPVTAQDRLDRDMDALRGYGTHDAYRSDFYDRSRNHGRYDGYNWYGRSGGTDRYWSDRYYDPYPSANTWGGSYSGPAYSGQAYGSDGGPKPGFRHGETSFDRRTGIAREYRDGKDWCYYRGDYHRGWVC